MQDQTSALSDVDFIHSHLGEYLDELLEKSQVDRFHLVLREHGLDDLPDRFKQSRGRFQMNFQTLSPSESLRHRLYELVEDDATRANNEAIEIEDLSRTQWLSHAGRLFLFFLVIGAVVFGAYRYLGPQSSTPFDALQALTYESDLIIENPGDRLDFLTQSISEMNAYFAQVPELGFPVSQFIDTENPAWELIGASAIDYEVAKILVAAFKDKKTAEDLLIYTFAGRLGDFPPSDQGTLGEFSYQAYATDSLNIIAWQANEQTVAMAVGSHGPESMADFASKLLAR